jgi:hypothetical protein
MTDNIPGDQLGGPAGSTSVYKRPEDITLTEISVDAREVDLHEIEHGKITIDEDAKTLDVEAAGELEILDDGRTRTTIMIGDAELSLTYNRDDQGSAERAAVLLAGAGPLVTQMEQAYDEGDLDPEEEELILGD